MFIAKRVSFCIKMIPRAHVTGRDSCATTSVGEGQNARGPQPLMQLTQMI